MIQHFEQLPRPSILLEDVMQNSLAAALEISSWLRTRGMRSEILHGELTEIIKRLLVMYNNFKAQRKLNGSRIGVIGTPSSWLISSNVDYLLAKRRWGIEYTDIPLERVTEYFNNISDDEVGNACAELAEKALACREASPEDMLKASEARHKEGKHVIPVPTMELKPYFKGYMVDPLRFLRNRKKEPKRFSEWNERSVVRPVFSYYGKLTFSDKVIESLVNYAAGGLKRIKIRHVRSKKSESQVNGLILYLDVTVRTGTPQEIRDVIHTMRDKVQREIEYTTGMSLESMKINITTGVAW